MLEFLLGMGTTSPVLFDFDSRFGIEGDQWLSQQSKTPLWGTKLSGNITQSENGVVFDGVANNRLLLNRPIEQYVNSFICQTYINTNASGRTGILLGNYNVAGNRNIEIHNNNLFRVYGEPGEVIFKDPLPKGRLCKFGFATNVALKQYEYYFEGQLMQTVKFTGSIGRQRSPFYIGGDTRTSYTLKGSIFRMVGFSTYLDENKMINLTQPGEDL